MSHASLAGVLVLAMGFGALCMGSVQPCPGDIDGDRNVGGADLAVVLAGWGQCPPGASCAADINSDGTVDAADLTVLLSSWGQCPVTVPAWATLLEASPDAAVVTSPVLRTAIVSTGYAWRVRHTATQIEMVLIPPGSFRMGCSASNLWSCAAPESPVHEVTLTQPFYLGRYEVTQAQWQAVMGFNPSHFQASNGYPGSDSRPVESVTWGLAHTFVTEAGMRLPTEAEWEFAYRAGTMTSYHGFPDQPDGISNESMLGSIACFNEESASTTQPVGSRYANGFGLHDMSGNAWEWVSDWFGADYYASSLSTNPTGPATGTKRVLRGGSWNSHSGFCRASYRTGLEPSFLADDGTMGVRVAANP